MSRAAPTCAPHFGIMTPYERLWTILQRGGVRAAHDAVKDLPADDPLRQEYSRFIDAWRECNRATFKR